MYVVHTCCGKNAIRVCVTTSMYGSCSYSSWLNQSDQQFGLYAYLHAGIYAGMTSNHTFLATLLSFG